MSSSVLESLLKDDDTTWDDFLESIWEKKCHRFVFHESTKNLWTETVSTGWKVLTRLMDRRYIVKGDRSHGNTTEVHSEDFLDPPLLFRSLQPMDDPDEIHRLYGNSLYAAYLAGTSIVWNHVDLQSPQVAALCEDLQGKKMRTERQEGRQEQCLLSNNDVKTFASCFPHAYANAYLTPPGSQTVPPHADDRDVLVFQLLGQKKWRIYEERPIPHPYTHEQVGKSGLQVPDSVLNGPLTFDETLQTGDVLYIPRGMVHEANTDASDSELDFSFHITVAIATHDWTLGGNLSRMIQAKLVETMNDVTNLRRSLLPPVASIQKQKENDDTREKQELEMAESTFVQLQCGGFLVEKERIEKEIGAIFERLRTEITAEAVAKDLDERIKLHNQRAAEKRKSIMMTKGIAKLHHSPETTQKDADNPMSSMVGPSAAQMLCLDSLIRAATPSEKACAPKCDSPGLNVRDEIGDDISKIVGRIKEQTDHPNGYCVGDFRGLLRENNSLVCDLTSLSLAKLAVEIGAFVLLDSRKGELLTTKRRRVS